MADAPGRSEEPKASCGLNVSYEMGLFIYLALIFFKLDLQMHCRGKRGSKLIGMTVTNFREMD